MQKVELTISEVLSESWQKVKSQYGIIIGSLLTVWLINGAFNILSNIANAFTDTGATSTRLIMTLISLIISIGSLAVGNLLYIGLTRIELNIIDTKQALYAQLFDSENIYWRYLGATFLYALIVLGGLILFIIPGIYWAIKYQFIAVIIVDKKLKVTEALKASGEITQGHKGWLLGFSLILVLLNIAGFMALILGLLVTIPITVMAQIYVYRKLSINISSTTSVKTPVAN
ncbi:hypothetical protein H0W80_01695 [Candidatus Saccharibacteria bacterium]|nr:hypothetical protein [Candidatus Saccharibacteria bacterium]